MIELLEVVCTFSEWDREEFVLNTEIRDTQLQRNREQVSSAYIRDMMIEFL
jgi:hypothetical protein